MICSLKFEEDVLLKNTALDFCAFGFEAIPHASCYLTSIVDKTCHGPVIALFCATSAVL